MGIFRTKRYFELDLNVPCNRQILLLPANLGCIKMLKSLVLGNEPCNDGNVAEFYCFPYKCEFFT